MPASPADAVSGIDLRTTVVVDLAAQAPTPAGDHRALIALVARLIGVDGASVSLAQHCPTCGGAGHGPLRVVLAAEAAGAPALHVSLARAAGRRAVAVTAAGPVGIDLESLAQIARAPVADVLLSPAETDALAALDPPAARAALAVLWTSKEAVLKAAGVGLRVDPRDLTITIGDSAAPAGPSAAGGRHRLVHWPGSPFSPAELHLLPAPAPAGFTATVAVVSAHRPALRGLPAPH